MDLDGINNDEVRVQRLLQAIPFFTEDSFMDNSAPGGVYTFLLIINQAGEEQLVAKQATTVMELGTCHHSIASDRRLAIREVLCGGEIWKKANGDLEYNLLSGDYSWPRLRSLLDDDRDKMSEEMALAVRAFLPFARYRKASVNDTVEQRGSFIQPRNLLPPPDRALLDLYRSVGISVFCFPSRVACIGFRSANVKEKAEESYLLATEEAKPAARQQLLDLVAAHGGHIYGEAAAAPAPERKTRKQKQRKQRSLKRSARKSRRN
jgi:hypothetical protein